MAQEPPAVVLPPAELASAAANDSGGRAWLWGLLAVAAALVLVWWLAPGRTSPSTEPDPPLVALAPLPAYALAHDGGLTATRSEPSAPDPQAALRYGPGSRIQWVMTPAVAVEGEVGVRLFAFGEGTARALASEGLVQVSPKGAVRVAGSIDALGLSRGAWTIAIVVGHPAALPSDPAVVRDAAGTDAWTVQRLAVVLED